MMLKQRTIEKVERVGTSRNGNPRFRITLEEGITLLTKPDSGFAYSLVEGGSLEGSDAYIELDGRGNIVSIFSVSEYHKEFSHG